MKISADHREYLQFMAYLWKECDDLQYGPKSLYCCLLTYEHQKKNTCWVCQETLSRHLCCAINSLKTWTELLEEKDMIRCERSRRGKKSYIKYVLFHPQHRNRSVISLSKFRRKGKANVVPFPSLNCPISTPSTTQKAGNLDCT
jgi:hypothetical protein